MKAVQLKRESFHNSIKKNKLQTYKNQIRKELFKQESHSQLAELIKTTQTQINSHQLEILVFLVNNDFDNAIIHLGNIIIDQIVQTKIFQFIKFTPKKSQYWAWLIRILGKNSYWDFPLLDFCISNILKNSSQFILEHCLQTIKLSIDAHRQQALHYLFLNEKLILKLAENCFQGNIKIQCLCFDIIDSIVQQSQSFTIKFINCFKQIQCLKQFLKRAFMKSNNKIKVQVVRIFNNILYLGIQLSQVYFRYVNALKLQGENVKTQLSYLLVTYIQTVKADDIQNASQQLLMLPLIQLKDSYIANQKNKTRIHQNIVKYLELLYNKKLFLPQIQWKIIQIYFKKHFKQFVRQEKQIISEMEAEQFQSNIKPQDQSNEHYQPKHSNYQEQSQNRMVIDTEIQ